MQDPKIIDYYILTSQTSQFLADKVKIALSKGWELYGYGYSNNSLFVQPMVFIDFIREYDVEGNVHYIERPYQPIDNSL